VLTGIDSSSNEEDIIVSSELAIAVFKLLICSIPGKEFFDGP